MDIGRTNKRITFCRYEERENALSQTEQALTEVKTVWSGMGERGADKGQGVPRGAAGKTGTDI